MSGEWPRARRPATRPPPSLARPDPRPLLPPARSTVDDKGRPQEIGVDDVRQAIRKLGVLGGGFAVVDVGGKLYVRSVPGELDQDANSVLGEARERGYTSVQRLEAALGWDGSRAEASLGRMVDDGLALVDDGGDPGEGRLFWIPSLSSSMQGAVRGD